MLGKWKATGGHRVTWASVRQWPSHLDGKPRHEKRHNHSFRLVTAQHCPLEERVENNPKSPRTIVNLFTAFQLLDMTDDVSNKVLGTTQAGFWPSAALSLVGPPWAIRALGLGSLVGWNLRFGRIPILVAQIVNPNLSV